MKFFWQNQQPNAVLQVATLISPVIGSRDIAQSLRASIEQMSAKAVVLDLAKVEFISRSAVHELLQLKNVLKVQSDKDVYFENLETPVRDMFKAVAANRALSTPQKPRFNAEQVDVKELFETA